MAYVIATAGKGGTGKTTIAALLISYLTKNKKGSVLAVDADPNSNLNQALGVELKGTVIDILDKMAAKKDAGLPSGMTKEQFIEYEIQAALTEAEGFDLLAMGRPEGPGCYCYANNVLRGIINKLSAAYDYVVIDNEAGMEHLSRRIAGKIDTLFVISDFSRVGVRSAKRISVLAGEMELKVGSEYLIVNMAAGDIGKLKDEIEKSGLRLAGTIPFDERIEECSLADKPVMDSLGTTNKIFERTIGG